MKKLFTTTVRLVLSFVRGCACLSILAAVALFLALNHFGGSGREGTQTIEQLRQIIAEKDRIIEQQESRIEELTEQLGTTYQVHRQVNVTLLPGLEWEWLEFGCFDFWDEVSKSSYDGCVEGQREILYSSGFLQWSFTALERTTAE